jgi:hypothetical protein
MATTPTHNYTRLALAIVVAALVIGSVAYLTISAGKNTSSPTTTGLDTTTITGFPSSLQQAFGSSVSSLSVAETYLNASELTPLGTTISSVVSEPTLTPSNLTLTQIRAYEGSIALIYNSSQLTPLTGFTVNVAMFVTFAQDGSSYRFPSQYITSQTIVVYNSASTVTESISSQTNPLYAEAVNESINGNLGVATPGDLNWWANGLHFEIVANLPIATLVDIADSMI